jgi:zinc protease
MNTPFRLPELEFTKTTLGNGLDVIVRRQPHLPIVAVNLWYHVGSKNEERRQRGFAHLFEHLMFEGSEHFPGDYFKPLQRLGGNVNGSTSSDRTNYFVDIPTAHLALVLAMESDRMGHLLPALTDAKLRVQKDVVKNEYRQNYANRPYGQVSRLLAEALYPPEHPYSWLTIGVMEDVEAATREDVDAFFRRYYVPSNSSLCLVGDLDETEGLDLARRFFGDLPGGTKALPLRHVASPKSRSGIEIRIHDRVELDRFYMAWHTVPQFHVDDASLGLLADILARGRSSRLYRRLVVEEQLAQDVSAYQSSRELAGTFAVVVTMRPGKDLERARTLALQELEAIQQHGPTKEELERVRNGRVAGFVYALDNIGGFGGVADRLNAYNIYCGEPGRITSDVNRYLEPTEGRVAEVASRHFVDGCASLTVFGRKASTVVPLDRSKIPEAGPAVAFRAPLPEVRRLSCGASLWVIPRRDVPIVSATVVVTAGAGAHGPEQGGLASLTSDMMDEGTLTRNSQAIAFAAESLGTSLSASSGWDGSYVSLQCLTHYLEPSFDLACDVFRNPTFPESEWLRVRDQSLASLKAERDSAEARAHRRLLRTLYGHEHPYRLPVDGEESSVSVIEREDLIAFHRAHFRPDRATWVVAGDVDPARVEEILNQRICESTGPLEPLPAVLEPRALSSSRILLLDKPAAPQAVVRVGHLGLPRSHPDHDALQVLNQILGGQFNSRLNAKLREEKGFTYGVRSYFDFRRGPGPFLVSASIQADRLTEALSDLRQEVRALLDDRPPTATELDDARRALIEGQARQFETPSSLVARYAGLFLYDLPLDHHARLAERLSGISVSTLRDVAARHIRPDALITVVVADADQVAAGLGELGWAEVERVDG